MLFNTKLFRQERPKTTPMTHPKACSASAKLCTDLLLCAASKQTFDEITKYSLSLWQTYQRPVHGQGRGNVSVAIEYLSKTCAHAYTPSPVSVCIRVHVHTLAVFFCTQRPRSKRWVRACSPLIPPTSYFAQARVIKYMTTCSVRLAGMADTHYLNSVLYITDRCQ